MTKEEKPIKSDSADSNSSSTTSIVPVPEIPYSDLEFHERLSSGSYGTVYRARWISRDKTVAVKKVLVLEKEAQVLSLIRHKNIIQFFGAVSEPPNFCIVLEFAAKGSLYSFIHESEYDLQPSLLLKWATEIAQGVHYLHCEAPVKIIHRDLKSNNVVISENDVCKLCDFGTSKPLLHTAQMTMVGTIAWMSPEMIQCRPVSETSDTWSYAVVLWELLTRQLPFKGCESFRIAWMIVEENVRLCVPSTCPAKLANFLQRCWEKEPKKRPLFVEILQVLHDLADDEKSSSQTKIFLTQKDDWLHEIEEHVAALKAKEQELMEREAKLGEWERRLTRREQNMENSRRLSHSHANSSNNNSNNFNSNVGQWSADDVANWFRKLSSGGTTTSGVNKSTTSLLCNHLRDNRIDGLRLRLMTDNDLRRMGMSSPSSRSHFLDEIRQLWGGGCCDRNYSSFFDFSQFAAADEENEAEAEPPQDYFLDLTVLIGFYVREGINKDTHKWKMFMDVDDVIDYENGLELIDHVIFTVSNTNNVFKFDKAPFIMDKWVTGFRENVRVDCEVHFIDLVHSPKSETIQYQIDYNRRHTLEEYSVKLKVNSNESNDHHQNLFKSQSSPFGLASLINSKKLPMTETSWQKNFQRSSSSFVDAKQAFEMEKSKSPRWNNIFSTSDLNRDQCGDYTSVLRKKSDALLIEQQHQQHQHQQNQQVVPDNNRSRLFRACSDDAAKNQQSISTGQQSLLDSTNGSMNFRKTSIEQQQQHKRELRNNQLDHHRQFLLDPSVMGRQSPVATMMVDDHEFPSSLRMRSQTSMPPVIGGSRFVYRKTTE